MEVLMSKKAPEKRRRAFWRLYFLILTVSLFTLILAAFFYWNSLVSETKTELRYTNRMMQSSMNSILKIDEALLKTTGERILENGLFENKIKIRTILNMLLKDNPAFAGVGLATVEGEVVVASSNMDSRNIPNLRTSSETAESFAKALESDTLVIGRTYYLDELKQWIAPIRYRITDADHKVVAVLAGGIKIYGEHSPWTSGKDQQDIELSIVRADSYFQYYSEKTEYSSTELYSHPIDENYLKVFDQKMKTQTGWTRNQLILKADTIVSFIYPRSPDGHSIAAISYDDTYDLFIITKKNIVNLFYKVIPPIIWLILTLIGFNIILYMLFKYHEKLQLQSEKNLEFIAEHDQLTGLPNMRFLTRIFDHWVKQQNDQISVLFIDLDNFKEINDLHNHSIGDEVIKSVAILLKKVFPECLCIRQGGDEFIVVINHAENCLNICETFLEELKQPLHIGELEFSLRASIGISRYPVNGREINQLLRNADIAMYEAKKNKTGISVYNKRLVLNKEKYALISKELNHALNKNEMYVVYQPQIDIQTNQIIGVESLVRWNNDSLGEVLPDEFISVAESTGSIYDIGDFVLLQALNDFNTVFKKFIEDYAKNNPDKFKVSINISTNQLVSKAHIISLIELIKANQHKDIKLVLEITESVNLDKIDNIVESLNLLKDSDIKISLDDFGTGYSSLSHIIKLPIDEIKIDKSFVQAMEHDRQSEVLVKSIVSLSHNLNVDILSEGVETQQQLDYMKRFDCRYYQGYYFSRPLNKDDLIPLLKKSVDTSINHA